MEPMPTAKFCRDFPHLGLSEQQDWPGCVGKYTGILLIVASARCVWSDVERVDRYDDIMAVNDIGMHLPYQLTHWYSSHGNQLKTWEEARSFRYKRNGPVQENRPILLHSCFKGPISWPFPGHGGSGLSAVYTGLALGYDKIVVAGMPLDDSGHYFDPPNEWGKWSNFHQEVPDRTGKPSRHVPVGEGTPRFWDQCNFNGRVEVMSCRIREFLK